ncbi:MAG: VacJ family lipoprotein [Giesbergeria sp.]|nr:VacJ family lipoprotein [Giesbergeria sp.]
MKPLSFSPVVAPATAARPRRLPGAAAAAAFALLLSACASGPPTDPPAPYNRGMATFNDNVDSLVLKPVATVYKTITPPMARTGVSNFFSNLGDAWSFVNNALQLHPEGTLNSAVRFTVNTVFGIGGVFDVASEMGVDRRRQDFGLTLGRWGVPTGPYVVLPLLGSSTVRDTLALPVDAQGNLLSTVYPVTTRNSLLGLRLVNTRANLLRASEVLDTAALDKYTFTRDVFLNLRSQGMDAGDGSLGDGDDGGLQDGRLPDEPY